MSLIEIIVIGFLLGVLIGFVAFGTFLILSYIGK